LFSLFAGTCYLLYFVKLYDEKYGPRDYVSDYGITKFFVYAFGILSLSIFLFVKESYEHCKKTYFEKDESVSINIIWTTHPV
jgi:hypothetical protein